jgi:glycosyltransferase involved in cell wall biosynthesis
MSKIILFGLYPPPYGGVAIYVYALNEFLKRSGGNCELKIYRQHSDSNSNDVKPTFVSIFKNFLKLKKGDTCVDSTALFLGDLFVNVMLAWLLVKFLRRFKWIRIIHDGSLPARYKTLGIVRKSFSRLSIRFVDEFIAVSEDLCFWLRDNMNVRQKVTLIKSLLPIPANPFDSSLSAEVERSICHYDKLVCSVGVFIPSYGFKHIVDAVESIRDESGLDIGLLLIDGSFAVDENYKSEVLQKKEWIVVLKNIPHPQVLQFLKWSDVFVRGVAFESYGLSRVEALWSGTPVVATAVGETRGMLLYDFGNEKELIQQIKRALFHPPTEDIKAWGDHFYEEANDNLMALIRLIDPGRGHVCSTK